MTRTSMLRVTLLAAALLVVAVPLTACGGLGATPPLPTASVGEMTASEMTAQVEGTVDALMGTGAAPETDPAGQAAPPAEATAPAEGDAQPPEGAAPAEAPPGDDEPLPPVAAVAPAPESVALDGPQLIFAVSGDGIVAGEFWAVSADGAQARALLTGAGALIPVDWQTAQAISPDGQYLAYVSTEDPLTYRGLALNLLRLADGERFTVTPLTSAETGPQGGDPAEDPNFPIARALAELNNVAWSPDGLELAFTAATDSANADVYVYTLATGALRRLTSTDSQAIRPTWSPDGRTIVFAGVGTLGSGAGYDMRGVWAVPAEGGALRLLYTPESGDELWLGWTDAQTLVVYSWGAMCGPNSLRRINVETGDTSVTWAADFSEVALDPASGAALVTVNQYTAGCGMAGDPGVFFVGADGGWEPVSTADAYHPVWSPEAGAFFAWTAEGAVQVSPAGDAVTLTTPAETVPVVSAGQAYWAWASAVPDDAGVWAGPYGEPPARISDARAAFPTWSPDGSRLFYVSGESIMMAAAPDFTPQPAAEGVFAGTWAPAWAEPPQ